ncbi:IS5 family transposase, partial [Candidatus Bathyarchaeota archaeon]|nr:IS5 family transposase [Candidatus Bathyarchaeota archaeon]
IKHKLCLSDEETGQQIEENPYLQYFAGLPGFQTKAPFVPSLFVEIRRRMGQDVFEVFHRAIINSIEEKREKSTAPKQDQDNDQNPPSGPSDTTEQIEQLQEESPPITLPENRGKLILDATVAEQAIRYPTDLSLLNEARELTEKIIDELHAKNDDKKKPRTYRQNARKAYLAIVKQRKPGAKVIRRGIRQQLQYLRRNLGYIEQQLQAYSEGTPIPLLRWLVHRYWVIQHLYEQQQEMYNTKTRRCDDRIVSISQPHVRPIIRGKLNKNVEFGAKLSASLTEEGIARVDQIRWDAFNEGNDLAEQVEAYRERYGYYPEAVLGDPAYGNRENRAYLKKLQIRFAGKPLGRPKKMTEENREELKQLKKQRHEEYCQRIPIEGKFGQGKNGYNLNYIRAKTARTSEAWINSIFLVMNLLILARVFFVRCKSSARTLLVWCWRNYPVNNLRQVKTYGASRQKFSDRTLRWISVLSF